MNLDIPFKLYPQTPVDPKDGFADVYVTDDERWIIMRRTNKDSPCWTVMDRQEIRGPRDVPSLDAAVREIKERLTGRSCHMHQPEEVLARFDMGAKNDRHAKLQELTRLSELVPGGYR